MGRQLFFVLMILAVSLGAQALTGSGESGAGALETVSPSLQSVSAVTERSLSATFSEAMLLPGITTPENYAVSGLGAGTLAATPDGVTGGGPYALTWTAGEMRNGASVTVTATGVQDAVGNPINPAHATASGSGMGVAPVFSGLSVTPAQASAGATVTITFTASETLDGDPVVTVNGHEATWISGAKAVDYVYEYEVQPTDSLGTAALSVTGSDLAGNTGGLNDSALLEIVGAEPGLPLYAWPLGLVLLATGLLLLRGLRKSPLGGGARGMFLLLALFIVPALVCSTAFAQAPTVSNVTFTQSPTATGTQVDIHYDLLAPNGPCAITVWLSKDGGTDGYSSPVTSVTGDLTNVTTGLGKHIVWDIRADYAEEDIPNAQLRVTADDGLVQHTLTYTAGPNGSMTGTSPQVVNHGGNGTEVTAVPNTGYHFVQWSDGILTAARTDTNVTGDINVTAEFAANANLVFCWANPSEAGSVTGPATILTGGTAVLTVSTNPGYTYQSISAIIGDVTGSYPNFTLSNVTADVTVTADFTLNQYMLMYTAGANGSISGTSPQMVSHGGSGTQVTAVPNGGYAFSQWSDGVLTAARTDTNVMADINVTANFVPAAPLVTSFAINGGAATTTGPEVTLDNVATESPLEYMASEASDFAGASWQAYGTAPTFTLSAGTGGTKTVHFKVRNADGESAPVSDTIDLVERTILLPGSVPLVLRWVPSGSFQMGRYAGEVAGIANEDPQHPVTLAYGFWMGKYEVTQQQWIAVRSTWPSTAPSVAYGLGNTYPAYYISWNNAKDFITTLNAHIVSSGQGPLTVRLPNEAEWEYACRGGTQTRFYWGDDSGYTQIGAYAWYNGNNSPNGSKAVSGKMGNAFGLYDMIGNIGEWCEDDYHGSYTGAPNDGSPWIDSPRASYRLIRGGYWDYLAMHCRSAFRGYSGPGSPDFAIGFRLAAVE